jgi:predicted MFS family arabinose efflux permease
VTATAIAFAGVERRAEQPMLDPRLLGRPALAGATAAALLAYSAAFGFLFLNTLYLQRVRGFSPLHAGVAILPMTAAVAITAPVSGRLTGRRGPRGTIAAAGLLITCAMAVLATITPATSYAILAVAYALLGIGWGAINPPITSLAMSALPRARSGMASAIAGSARQVGSLLGVALMGSLIAGHPGSAGDHFLAGHLPAHDATMAAIHLGDLVGLGAGVAVTLLATVIRLPATTPDTTSETSTGEPSPPRTPAPPATPQAGRPGFST